MPRNLGSQLADIADDARQRVFYDVGVGVEADSGMRTRIGAAFSRRTRITGRCGSPACIPMWAVDTRRRATSSRACRCAGAEGGDAGE
jgi:hypothetical protein